MQILEKYQPQQALIHIQILQWRLITLKTFINSSNLQLVEFGQHMTPSFLKCKAGVMCVGDCIFFPDLDYIEVLDD